MVIVLNYIAIVTKIYFIVNVTKALWDNDNIDDNHNNGSDNNSPVISKEWT